jgi:N-acetylglucosaminyldiphosphoundecaprenol N-acetyl-beta-D-mannosaminyltransferase
MIDLGRHNVLGIRIDAVDYEAAVQRIVDAAREHRPLGVSALAVHGVMTGVLDAAHRYRLNALEMVVPDGQPVRWALNALYGLRLNERVYGPTLMWKTCERMAREGMPVFLYGGTDELLDALSRRLQDAMPDLRIAGRRASRFRCLSNEERDQLVEEIRDSGAAITLVGLGCPRQEVWAFEFRERLSMPLLAVGAAFSFHAGRLSQAPDWMQHRGLEWLYRLLCEPARLWKRYLLLNPLYLALLALQWSGLRTLAPETGRRPTGEILYG